MLNKKSREAYDHFYNSTIHCEYLDTKTEVLVGLAAAMAMNCLPCQKYYLTHLKNTTEKFISYSQKQLKGIHLNTDGKTFLKGLMQLIKRNGKGLVYAPRQWNGWYVKLFYNYKRIELRYNPYMDFFPTAVSITKGVTPGHQGVLHVVPQDVFAWHFSSSIFRTKKRAYPSSAVLLDLIMNSFILAASD